MEHFTKKSLSNCDATNVNLPNKPGVITHCQELASDLGLSEAFAQYTISYTSCDSVHGEIIREDTGAVFIPKSQAPKNGWPVIVWNHGTVGIAPTCAPSLTPKNSRVSQYLNTWLSLGFAIVAPDYPGLGSSGLHHYMDERATAWSSLDSAKAVLKGGFSLSNRFIFMGQSQGAHAAFASVGYQPEYAPELNILGAIVTGTPYFSDNLLENFISDGVQDEGDRKLPYAMYLYLSAADKNPNLKVEDYFQELAIPYVEKAKTLCISPLSQLVMDNKLNASNSLKPKFYELLEQEASSLNYRKLLVDKPVFIGIGLEDIHVLTRWQQEFARDVLEAGTNAYVYEYPNIGHLDVYNVSLRNSVPFVFELMKNEHSKID